MPLLKNQNGVGQDLACHKCNWEGKDHDAFAFPDGTLICPKCKQPETYPKKEQ